MSNFSDYKPGDRVRSTASVGPAGVGSVGTISKRYFSKATLKTIVVRWDDWDYDDGVGENHGDNGHWIGYESIELLQPPPTDEEIAELFGLASKPEALTIAGRIEAGELDDELEQINLALIKRFGDLRQVTPREERY